MSDETYLGSWRVASLGERTLHKDGYYFQVAILEGRGAFVEVPVDHALIQLGCWENHLQRILDLLEKNSTC